MGYTHRKTKCDYDSLYDVALEFCYGNAVQNKTALTHPL
jgi:hypothetical protein